MSDRPPVWYVESEIRFDHEYDDHAPATVRHPNGSLICGVDREFLGAVAREVYLLRLDALA